MLTSTARALRGALAASLLATAAALVALPRAAGAAVFVTTPPDTLDDATATPRNRHEPAVAFGAGQYFAVWQALRGTGEADIEGALVTPGPPGSRAMAVRRVTIPSVPGVERSPDVAFTGRVFLVVWDQSRSGTGVIAGAAFDPLGNPAGSGMFTVGPMTELAPTVACNAADQCMVAWHAGGGTVPQIGAAMLDTRATLVVTLQSVPPAPAGRNGPSLAFAGTEFLLAYSESNGMARSIGAMAHPVTPGPFGPARIVAASTGANLTAPSLACDPLGGRCVVAFVRGGQQVLFNRMLGDGSPLGMPVLLATSMVMATQASPAVTFDGGDFLVAWEEVLSTRQVHGQRVGAMTGFVDATPFPISMGGPAIQPAAASQRNGVSFVVYRSQTNGVDGRFVSDLPAGARCATDADCASGVCAGGVCCAMPCRVPPGCAPFTCMAMTGACLLPPGCGDAGVDAGGADGNANTDAAVTDAARDVVQPFDAAADVGAQDAGPPDAPVPDASTRDGAQPASDAPPPALALAYRGGSCACDARGARTAPPASLLAAAAAIAALAARRRSRPRRGA